MNDKTFDVMKKIETLKLSELEEVSTWIDFCIEKRKNPENSDKKILSSTDVHILLSK